MTKFEALREIFDIEDVSNKLLVLNLKLTVDQLLNAISKHEYSLIDELPVTERTITKTLKKAMARPAKYQ